jgi:hypothetical protein
MSLVAFVTALALMAQVVTTLGSAIGAPVARI